MKVFIASSTEAKDTARKLASWLEEEKLKPIVWNDPGVFHAGEFNYQSLLRISTEVQAAIILMTEDDKLWYRDTEKTQPRDNVLIEFGLFSSRLGLSNAIIIGLGTQVMSSISDLAGINCIDMSMENKARLAIAAWSARLLLLQEESLVSKPNKIITDESTIPCQADWKISERRAKIIGVDIKAKDASNLFFILLCVRSCEQSRTRILALEAESHNIIIEALYDLMGTWDLLIKFRAESDVIANEFYQKIIAALILKKQMVDVDSEAEPFGKRNLINVLAQSKTINGLISPNNDEKINYTLLPNNSDYDKYRASRSFMFIYAVGDKGDKVRKAFLKALNKAIEKGTGQVIIESICEGEKELLIETLSTCSQSAFINHLNREIEEVLTDYFLQKYTLSCYYYDEDGLLNNAKAVEET